MSEGLGWNMRQEGLGGDARDERRADDRRRAAAQGGVVSERQQLAEALYASDLAFDNEHHGLPTYETLDQSGEREAYEAQAAAVEPFLVAAERAGYERGIGAPRRECGPLCSHLCCDKSGFDRGYERCKRDATMGIEALRDHATHSWELEEGEARIEWGATATGLDDALAVVAALNTTQQRNAPAPYSAESPGRSLGTPEAGPRSASTSPQAGTDEHTTATQQEASDG